MWLGGVGVKKKAVATRSLPRWKSPVPFVNEQLAKIPSGDMSYWFDLIALRTEGCGCRTPRESGMRSGSSCEVHRYLASIAMRMDWQREIIADLLELLTRVGIDEADTLSEFAEDVLERARVARGQRRSKGRKHR